MATDDPFDDIFVIIKTKIAYILSLPEKSDDLYQQKTKEINLKYGYYTHESGNVYLKLVKDTETACERFATALKFEPTNSVYQKDYDDNCK
jgi:hypothetical protein